MKYDYTISNIINIKPFVCALLKHIRVEFNALGDLKEIVNLDKNLAISFNEQGFYWYASK